MIENFHAQHLIERLTTEHIQAIDEISAMIPASILIAEQCESHGEGLSWQPAKGYSI